MLNEIQARIKAEKLIAIIRGDYSLDAIRVMARALLDAQIHVLEVTMNSMGVLDAIRLLSREFGDRMLIGAGTVLDETNIPLIAEAGGRFVVSPETHEPVIKAALESGLEPMPGAFTPTECMAASRAGASLIKLFPASLGGPDYLKAIRAPLDHLDFVVTGGVDTDNAKHWLQAGAVALGLGGSLVPKQFDGSPEAASDLTRRGLALREAIR